MPNSPFDLEYCQLTDPGSIQRSFLNHLHYTLAKDRYSATKRDYYMAMSYAVRDYLIHDWIGTSRSYYHKDCKRVYYLSLEFLMGQSLHNSLINTGLYDNAKLAMDELGLNLDLLCDIEWDSGLGNGGLGRLAACFLDSLASLALPGYGYGLRYEYGIFTQKIENGYQVETPDNWLRYGNPWEIIRSEALYQIDFYGRLKPTYNSKGEKCYEWIDTEEVIAMPYDTPIPGYRNNCVNNLRLWTAKSARGFDLTYFNHGDYMRAVEDRNRTENITQVLYPNDNMAEGRELRLKQEYFLVSATLQDILRRYRKIHGDISQFAVKNAIQLNDTHPALAITELMRILLDQDELAWDVAWKITTEVFGYTNHTIMPEALEKWPVSLLEKLLPRHLQIIYDINQRFLHEIDKKYPGDVNKLRRMSLVEEGYEKKIRMANLAVIGSHRINGVSKLHSEMVKHSLFPDFYAHTPDKFINVTNGITPRRWLKLANPLLAELISQYLGPKWVTDLDLLQNLRTLGENKTFCEQWEKVRHENKKHLSHLIKLNHHFEVNPDNLFTCQIKRIHEYKRQLLNVLYLITLYNRLKDGRVKNPTPRTAIFGGKAAPGYNMAKMIIKLIHDVGKVINSDPQINPYLQIVFMANYRVSLAEKIIPAIDLSEQISTAGTEASGTGNMKFALNGALTIGTLDGANIEIMEEVGKDNIFIFGRTSLEIKDLKENYNPRFFYEKNPELKRAIDQIKEGFFTPSHTLLFEPIVNSLLEHDQYFLLADYESYINCQDRVCQAYQDKLSWTKKSIHNVAGMGIFSSDRAIKDYAREIWNMPLNL